MKKILSKRVQFDGDFIFFSEEETDEETSSPEDELIFNNVRVKSSPDLYDAYNDWRDRWISSEG